MLNLREIQNIDKTRLQNNICVSGKDLGIPKIIFRRDSQSPEQIFWVPENHVGKRIGDLKHRSNASPDKSVGFPELFFINLREIPAKILPNPRNPIPKSPRIPEIRSPK
eukprot:6149126-Heterocapsa_arctica.AAC.1